MHAPFQPAEVSSSDRAVDRRALHVCHLAYTFYENDNRVIRYARAAAERGDRVDVIALRRNGSPRQASEGGVRVLRIQRRSVTERWKGAYFAKLVWFLIKSACVLSWRQVRHRYDVVHVHNVPDFLVFAACLPKLMGARLVLDIHDILPELYGGKFGAGPRSFGFRTLLLVERCSCWFADHVIVSNDIWHGRLVSRAVAPEKCTTFLNYPDLTLFKPADRGTKAADDAFLFLYPGTLNEHQGLDIAVRGFALVKDQMPRAQLHIYGEGPARRQLQALIGDLGLSGRVLLRDRLPLDQIARVMAAADVGVVPKRADGFGNEAFSTKILEFMASGIPVIVSRTQVDAYYFDDSVVRFFEPGSDRALADALLDVYSRRTTVMESVQNARELAVRHGWQNRSRVYLALLDSMVSKPHSRVEVSCGQGRR